MGGNPIREAVQEMFSLFTGPEPYALYLYYLKTREEPNMAYARMRQEEIWVTKLAYLDRKMAEFMDRRERVQGRLDELRAKGEVSVKRIETKIVEYENRLKFMNVELAKRSKENVVDMGELD
jgi:hypothetical protein